MNRRNDEGESAWSVQALPTTFIVDTNALGKQLGRSLLSQLKELCSKGVRVLVPDVVCLELASHDWETLEKSLSRLQNLSLVPTETNWLPALEARICQLVEDAGAEVLVTPASMYREAVRAQVLMQAPALPKNDPGNSKARVTTGAVDHVVYQHALAHASTDNPVCVLTEDKILKSTLLAAQGVVVHGTLHEANTVATYQRLDLAATLTYVKRLRSDEFRAIIRSEMTPRGHTQATVEGIRDLFELDDKHLSVSLYVLSVHEPVIREEWIDIELDLISLKLRRDDLGIESMTFQQSDPIPDWHPAAIGSVEEYLDAELSMVPTLLRPRRDLSDSATDGGMTYREYENEIVFRFDGDSFCRVLWTLVDDSRQMSHEGEIWFHSDKHLELELYAGDSRITTHRKGDLANLVMDHALVHLLAPSPGSLTK